MSVPHAPLGLSLPAASRFRRITVLTVALLAFFAAVLSFSGLRLLAIQAGFPPELAWIFPILIDGLVLTGSMGVIASTLTGIRTWYPWTITLIGVVASVVGNVASAPPDLLSQAVHAAPPIVFALSIEGLLRVYRVGAVALVLNQENSINTLTNQEEVLIQRGEKLLRQEEVLLEKLDTMNSQNSQITEQPTLTRPVVEETILSDTPSPLVNKPSSSTEGKTARERILELLETKPDITGGEASRLLDIDASHARKILRDIRSKNTTPEENLKVSTVNNKTSSADVSESADDPFA